MPQITPFLWFDSQAEEAAQFYVSVFRNSKIVQTTRFGDGGPGPKGSVITVAFDLDGQRFTALNGGPRYKFTEAFSLVVHCKDQADVDKYWNALVANGGEESMCGWLKDKYGLSWQIVPDVLPRLLSDPDPGRSSRAMQALLKMKKLDIATLQQAADAA